MPRDIVHAARHLTTLVPDRSSEHPSSRCSPLTVLARVDQTFGSASMRSFQRTPAFEARKQIAILEGLTLYPTQSTHCPCGRHAGACQVIAIVLYDE